MNHWTQMSVHYANQRSYLDDLYRIYPTIPNGIRDIDENIWSSVERNFINRNDEALLSDLLSLDLFPIKDSYVAYLKRDSGAIRRNPGTVGRLTGSIYEMGLGTIYEKCSEPKETNRQIGPMFKNWINRGELGAQLLNIDCFLNSNNNAVLVGSDSQMLQFASQHLGYRHNKGLDFIARFNGKYIIGEAKFLTDFGGHQNAQFADAISTLTTLVNSNVIKIAILDGVLYIPSRNKMYSSLQNEYAELNIMSALVLRNFLHSV